MPYTPSPARIDPLLPKGSWDTHFHIFPPSAHLAANAPFAPPRIPLSEDERFHSQLGTPNRVLAHSFALADMSSLEHWVGGSGAGERRALIRFTDDMGPEDILHRQRAGVRGIRAVTTAQDAGGKAEEIKAMMERLQVAGVRWTVAVQEAATPAVWDHLLAIVDTMPDQILMIDHLGFLPGPWARDPPQTPTADECRSLPHVDAVLALLGRKNTYVKLSAPYRLTSRYETLEGLVKAFAKVAPDRIVWASDWPFVPTPAEIKASKGRGEAEVTFHPEDMPRWIELLREWLGEDLFNNMMVANAANIYT
ncbi:hypothetical protein CspeluHIS016_0101740 [Cutaneotrichosporon spelunceum]|uniref:Amidohydrolase-related domain-containing protein n=1 Tax=Cutaneotrichosporon spelunceum TaxID=1672016 RepID=A0AAD3Y912_9TREE|nr:hypothetical protein CspeluHIS016_0101740 [Cutaneotrichosporon spelunceum]